MSAALGARPTAQTTSVRQRFVLDDRKDPFERTLGEGDTFGSALASLGDVNGDGLTELAIGAPGDHSNDGAVWVFSVRPSRQIAKFVKLGPVELLPFRLGQQDRFGSAIAALGDLDGNGVVDLAVGASGDGGIGFLSGPGAIYLLFLNPNGSIRDFRKVNADGGGLEGLLDQGDAFGSALCSPGDLDGNGVPDLVVGAPGDDAGGNETGALWVLFLDSGHHVQGKTRLSKLGNGLQGVLQSGERFGTSLATIGDLDGDGIAEVAAGSGIGRLRVLFLDAQGRVSHAVTVSASPVGKSVAGLGDVDGDGVPDLASNALVLLLKADGTLKASKPLAVAPYEGFGAALAAPGDTNSDGRPDLIVGSPGSDVRLRNSGAISFYEINANGVPDPIHRDVDANSSGLPLAPREVEASDSYGAAMAPVGDLDGNGLTEVAVGAPLDDDGAQDAGAVWIHFIQGGSGHRVEKLSATQSLLPLRVGDRFGTDIARLGDLDGNGAEDLAVSAPFDDDVGSDSGAVYVLFLAQNGTVLRYQKINGLATVPPATFHFGAQIEPVGDLDGDGHVELAVSALAIGATPANVWVLFLRADGTVRSQTLLDRTRVPNLNTTFGTTLADLGAAPGGLRYVVAGGNANLPSSSLWRLVLGADGQIQAAVQLAYQNAVQLAGLGDLDGNGAADLVALNSNGARTDFLFLAADFSLLHLFNLAGQNIVTHGLGALGDLTGDGLPDLAFGGIVAEHDRVLLLSLDGVVKWGFEHQDTADALPLENGRQIPRPHPGRTFVISSSGANLGATAFDSTPNGPNAGNDLCVDSGNLLLLQNSLAPTQTHFGIFDAPSDDPDGGLIGFDFPRLIHPLAIDLVDLDPFPQLGAHVVLTDDLNRTRTYTVPAGWTGLFGSSSKRTLALDTLANQPGAGPYPAQAFNDPGFNANRVVRIEAEFFSGGALDNLTYDPYP